MLSRSVAVSVLSLVAILMACGGDTPSEDGHVGGGGTRKDARARSVVEALFDLVRAGDRSAAAGLIAYRGKDEPRKWKAPSDYSNAEEKRSVDRICSRIESHLTEGSPTFEDFESEKESEGEWLVWHVRFGDGSERVAFACIASGGTMLLGEID